MEKLMYCSLCDGQTIHEIIDKCICNEDQGGGYTYQDEYGDCNYCLGKPARCSICNSISSLEMIDNFEPKVKEFILEKEKELNYEFVGCLESDNSLVFRGENVGDLRIIDIVFCENYKCEEYKIPKDSNKVGDNCANCCNSYYPGLQEEENYEDISDEELDRFDI